MFWVSPREQRSVGNGELAARDQIYRLVLITSRSRVTRLQTGEDHGVKQLGHSNWSFHDRSRAMFGRVSQDGDRNVALGGHFDPVGVLLRPLCGVPPTFRTGTGQGFEEKRTSGPTQRSRR